MQTRAAQRGMTLAELMIVVAILCVFVVGAGYGCVAMQSGDSFKHDAEEEARIYARDMNLKVDGLSCGDTPNSKGMVYCSLRSGVNTIPIACIGKWKAGHGCHEQRLTAPAAGEPQQ